VREAPLVTVPSNAGGVDDIEAAGHCRFSLLADVAQVIECAARNSNLQIARGGGTLTWQRREETGDEYCSSASPEAI
jgi:hypothetical protein